MVIVVREKEIVEEARFVVPKEWTMTIMVTVVVKNDNKQLMEKKCAVLVEKYFVQIMNVERDVFSVVVMNAKIMKGVAAEFVMIVQNKNVAVWEDHLQQYAVSNKNVVWETVAIKGNHAVMEAAARLARDVVVRNVVRPVPDAKMVSVKLNNRLNIPDA